MNMNSSGSDPPPPGSDVEGTWHRVSKRKKKLTIRQTTSSLVEPQPVPLCGGQVDGVTSITGKPKTIGNNLNNQMVFSKLSLARTCLKKRILLEGLIAEAVISQPTSELLSKTISVTDALTKVHPMGVVHSVLAVMRVWSQALQKTDTPKLRGINEPFLQTLAGDVDRLYCEMKKSMKVLPPLNFRANVAVGEQLLMDALCEIYGTSLCVFRGHATLGYSKVDSDDTFHLTQSSVVKHYWKMPEFILKISATNNVFVVLPESRADTICRNVFGKSLKDVRTKHVVEKFALKDQYIGKVTRCRVMERFKYTLAMKKDNSNVLEITDDDHGLICYSLKRNKTSFRSLIETYITSAREMTMGHVMELAYPNPYSNVRLEIQNGITLKNVSFHGEHSRLAATLKAESTLTFQQDISHLFSNCEGINSITLESRYEKNPTWLISLEHPRFAASILQDDGLLEYFTMEPRSSLIGTAPELVSVTCKANFDIHWIVFNDQCHKRKLTKDHIDMVRVSLMHLLVDVDERRVSMVVLPPQLKSEKLVHCQVTCGDRNSAIRVLHCLEVAEKRGVPLRIANKCDVIESLSHLEFKIDNRVYSAVKEKLELKLQNFEKTFHSDFSWRIQIFDKYVRLIVSLESDVLALQRVTERLQGSFKPMIKHLKRSNTMYLNSAQGRRLMDVVMHKTGTFITCPDFCTQVHVYGKRKSSQVALDLTMEHLDRGMKNDTHWCMLHRAESHAHTLNISLLRVIEERRQHLYDDDFQDVVFRENGDIVFYANKTGITKFQKIVEGITGRFQLEETKYVQCVVCYDDISMEDGNWRSHGYVLESCGHIYCTSCLRLQLREVHNSSTLPLLCAADNIPFSTYDMLNICGQIHCDDTNNLAKAAIRQFAAVPSNGIRFCPQRNCEGVYRINTDMKPITPCSQCSIKICPLCEERYHSNMTCEQFAQSHVSLQAWLHESPHRRKQCPKCRVGIEKYSGCDCVHCIHCNCVICWKCLKFFTSKNECYEHLQKQHDTPW